MAVVVIGNIEEDQQKKKLFSRSRVQVQYLLNSFLSPACISATIVFVTEVPMFAPMMIGIAALTVSTGKQKRKH